MRSLPPPPPAFCTSASPKSLVHSTSWMSAFASGARFCTEGGQKRVDISIGGATRTHKFWPHLTQEVESHNTGNSVSHTLRKRDKSLIMSSGVLKGKINKTQIKKKKVRVTLKVRAVWYRPFHLIFPVCHFNIHLAVVFSPFALWVGRDRPNPGVILREPYNEEISPEHKTNNLAWR